MSLKESTSWPVSSSDRRSARCVKSLVVRTLFIVCGQLAERARDRALQARRDDEADEDGADGARESGDQRLAEPVEELRRVDQEAELADLAAAFDDVGVGEDVRLVSMLQMVELCGPRARHRR